MSREDASTILIVNDLPDQLYLMSTLLRRAGYYVLTACDGYEGFDVASRELPDLIISDVAMPGSDGIELCKLIRAHPSLRLTPVLLVSAVRVDSASAIEGLQAGADDYLEAPYDSMRLVAKVARLIERKRAEEALKESEDRYRDLVENSQDLICTHDLNGLILSANRATIKLLGFDPDEYIGKKNIRDILAPEVRDQFDDYLDTIKREGAASGLMVVQTISGERRIWEYHNTLRTEGVPSPVVRGVAHDVTERKRAEAALCESERRYRELFENANDIIYTIDLAGNFTSINRAGERIIGYSREEILKMNLSQLVKPGQFEVFQQTLERKLAGEELTTYELEIIARDGHKVALEVSTRLIYQEGKPVGVQGIGRDVTERKNLEAQLRQAQRMESIGTLAGGVAHDFNNILTGIIGFSELAMLNLLPPSPIYRNLQEIKQLGERAARLTRQLLAFARKQVLARRPTNLNDLISDLAKFLRRVIGEHIELGLVLADDLAVVHADGSQIEQVLMNLCVNARDAMPQGGKLLIKTQNVTLDESYCQIHPDVKPGKYVLISVSDTGTGMDSATRERIFEPFFTTKGPGQGTGLGLAMVYGIIKQHDGSICVSSEPGRGATFDIYIPAISEQEEIHEERADYALADGNETILVAEDEASVRNLIVTILQNWGYKVLTASNGEEAVKVFDEEQGKIDLVLSDAVMPKLGGRELYEILRKRNPELKFLFISGYSIDAMSERFILSEGLELLHKPFNPLDLARRIRESLDR